VESTKERSNGKSVMLLRIGSLCALVPKYLERRSLDVARMRDALSAGDLGRVQIIGHQMKGSGGGYGFDNLSALGSEIEQAAMAQDLEALRGHISSLERFLEEVEVVCE
jgi:HPt (histidine-containing phosphotransfer) domain-containing protein